jgi:hypothetical protein
VSPLARLACVHYGWFMKARSILLALCLSLCFPLCFFGCDGDDDHTRDGRSFQPAAGMGAILIENASLKDWNIAIDRAQVGRAGAESFVVHSRAPGSYAVHLDEHEGSKEFDRSVAVEDGRVTVVRILGGFNNNRNFNVDVFMTHP